MQNTLYIEIIGCISEKGFSLDELVVKVKELFERKAMAEVIGLLLSLVDESICMKLVEGGTGWKPGPCCEDCRYEFYWAEGSPVSNERGAGKDRMEKTAMSALWKNSYTIESFHGYRTLPVKNG